MPECKPLLYRAACLFTVPLSHTHTEQETPRGRYPPMPSPHSHLRDSKLYSRVSFSLQKLAFRFVSGCGTSTGQLENPYFSMPRLHAATACLGHQPSCWLLPTCWVKLHCVWSRRGWLGHWLESRPKWLKKLLCGGLGPWSWLPWSNSAWLLPR